MLSFLIRNAWYSHMLSIGELLTNKTLGREKISKISFVIIMRSHAHRKEKERKTKFVSRIYLKRFPNNQRHRGERFDNLAVCHCV